MQQVGLQSNQGFRHTFFDIFTPLSELVQAYHTTANMLPGGDYRHGQDSLSLRGWLSFCINRSLERVLPLKHCPERASEETFSHS
jgi:hypothetical protein